MIKIDFDNRSRHDPLLPSLAGAVEQQPSGLPCLLQPAVPLSTPHVPVIDESHDRFGGHSQLLLPIPAMVTWNARGLFCADPVLQTRKLHVFGALCADHTIVCVQECHGALVDWEQLVPDSIVFTSLHPLGTRGGVALVIKEHFVENKHCKFHEIIPGRAISVTITINDLSFSLFVLHLEGEQHDHASRLEALRIVGNDVKRCASELIILGGDFNCEWPEDSLGEKCSWNHSALAREIDEWFGGWTRVIPSCPTFVGTIVSQARFLDCHLVNTRISFATEAQLSAATVQVQRTLEPPKCSDHLPVRLSCLPPAGNKPPLLASFLARDKEWVEDVQAHLCASRLSSLNAIEGLELVSRACRIARKRALLSRDLLPNEPESDAYHLQVAVRFWVRARWAKLEALLIRAPHWQIASTLAEDTGLQLDRLLLHKKEHLALQRDAAMQERVRAGELRDHHLRSSRLKWLGVLASWKKQRICSPLSSLSVHESVVTCPHDVLSALTQFWSPLSAAVAREGSHLHAEVLSHVVVVEWSPRPYVTCVDVSQFLQHCSTDWCWTRRLDVYASSCCGS